MLLALFTELGVTSYVTGTLYRARRDYIYRVEQVTGTLYRIHRNYVYRLLALFTEPSVTKYLDNGKLLSLFTELSVTKYIG